MDKFIHDETNGLSSYVRLGLIKLWLVRHDSEVIAFFSLSNGVLTLRSSDDRTMLKHEGIDVEEKIFASKDTFPSTEIDYLAVHKTWRNKYIGSFIIEAIAKKALTNPFSATMFLTVEALKNGTYSAVEFYKKCNFKDSEH